MECFITISAFLGAYKCMRYLNEERTESYMMRSLKLIGRKYLRIAPLFYIIFFGGWIAGPWLQA